MKNTYKLTAILALASTIAFTSTQAIITSVLAYYQLGEADPGAVAGNPGNLTTMDSSGNGFTLTRSGSSPAYSANTAPLAMGSTLAMQFNGSTDTYITNAPVSTAITDVALEAWVKADGLNDGYVVLNGSGGDGYGFYEHAGKWSFIEPGHAFNDGADVVPGQWAHLGLVLDAVGILHGYFNGVQVVTQNLSAPNTPSTFFLISSGFAGEVDQVRVFTFAPGAFSPSDFLITVPEPSTVLLLSVGGWLVWRRKSRRG